MQAAVTWDHGLTFSGTADTGFTVPLGGSPAVGGDDDGFRPMELFLIGLISCTAMDVISILGKKRQQVTDFRVNGEAEQAPEHPRVFTSVHIHYIVKGRDIDPKAVERAIELSETRYCPAQAMLAPTVALRLTYEIMEA
jgi:putative redox protein